MHRGASTLRNILVVLGSSWFSVLVSVSTVLVLPVKLGDSGMGQVTLALSFTGFFFVLIALGTSTYLMRAVARDRQLLSRYISNALLLRVVMAVLMLGFGVVLARLLGYSPTSQKLIVIVSIAMFVTSISNVFEAGLQGIGQVSYRSVAVAAGSVVSTVIGIGLLMLGADVFTYTWSILLGPVVQFAIVIAYYVRMRAITFNFDLSVMKALLVGGMPLFIWAFLQTAYAKVDTSLLGVFAPDHVVGWYGIAAQITGVLVMIPVAINGVVTPMLCELHMRSHRQFEALAGRAMTSSLLLLVPMGAGLALSSADIIRLLNYPEAFMNAVPPMVLMSAALPVTGVLMLLSSQALAIGYERQWVKITAFAACTFPLLYMGLIWLFQNGMGNGAIGASLANLIGELVLLALAWVVLPQELRPRGTITRALQIVALTGVMCSVVVLLQSLGASMAVYVPAGGLVYAAGAWALKLITPGDLHVVRSALLRRRLHAEAEAAS
jgi:O-antigen/teichoic acid export membrane protein